MGGGASKRTEKASSLKVDVEDDISTKNYGTKQPYDDEDDDKKERNIPTLDISKIGSPDILISSRKDTRKSGDKNSSLSSRRNQVKKIDSALLLIDFKRFLELESFPLKPLESSLLTSVVDIDRQSSLVIYISAEKSQNIITKDHDKKLHKLCIEGIGKIISGFAPGMYN